MKVRFVVLEPEAKRGVYDVPLPILVGRGAEAKFRIQEDRISRRHCELFEREGDVYVRDLGSTNGTFLGDEQIAASVRTAVPPGSVIRVGSIEIRVEYQATGRLPSAVPSVVDEAVDEAGPPPEAEAEFEADAAAVGIDPSMAGDAAGFVEEEALPEPGGFPDLEEPGPVVESFEGLEGADPQPGAADGFDFLGGESAADSSDDDKLGDFFKGLK